MRFSPVRGDSAAESDLFRAISCALNIYEPRRRTASTGVAYFILLVSPDDKFTRVRSARSLLRNGLGSERVDEKKLIDYNKFKH